MHFPAGAGAPLTRSSLDSQHREGVPHPPCTAPVAAKERERERERESNRDRKKEGERVEERERERQRTSGVERKREKGNVTVFQAIPFSGSWSL